MSTECARVTFEFHRLFQRKVRARFDGGTITSSAGALMVREVEKPDRTDGGIGGVFSGSPEPAVDRARRGRVVGAAGGYGLCLG